MKAHQARENMERNDKKAERVLAALVSATQLEDRPLTGFADAVVSAGRDTESFRYFISVGRVARAALRRKTDAGRAAFVVGQAEQSTAHLGVGPILRHSEAFAAWVEGKWDPPASEAAPNAAAEARRIATLAFIADVRDGMAAEVRTGLKARGGVA